MVYGCSASSTRAELGRGFMDWLPFRENHGVFVGKPLTTLDEVLAQHVHCQIYHPTVGITYVTLEGVFRYVEREAWVTVLVEGTQALMLLDCESESLSDSLNGEFAELLNVGSIH